MVPRGWKAYQAYRQFLARVPAVEAGAFKPPVEWEDLDPPIRDAWAAAETAMLEDEDHELAE